MPPKPTPKPDHNATDNATETPPETGAAFLHFYPLPHYEDDRRHDSRARGELAAALPYTEDYAAKLRLIVLPGWYAVEERINGKIKQRWVLEVEPDERTITAERASVPPPAPAVEGASLAQLIKDALAEQREQFEDSLAELRDELADRDGAKERPPEKSMAQQLRETLEAAAALNEFTGRRTNGAHDDDPFDKVMTMFDRITEVQERVRPSAFTDPAAGNIEKFLSLADRAIKEAPRVVAAWRKKGGGSDDSDDGDGDEMTAEDYASACMDYALGKLVADEPISFTDEPFAALALNSPAYWEQLISSLRMATPAMMIAHFSDTDEFPAWYASALKAKHAPRWIEQNLIGPAKSGAKKKAAPAPVPTTPAEQTKGQSDL